MSESVIVKALIEAKKEFKPLIKNKTNPHFKSKYADLSSVSEAVDEALARHGLTYVQPIERLEGEPWLVTRLKHVSGEELASYYPLTKGLRPQELASAITYGRRNSLCALLGISGEDDDDGNAASNPAPAAPTKSESKHEGPQKWTGIIKNAEKETDGANKFLHIVGEDGTDLLLKQPDEKAKADMDLYNMMCLDVSSAVSKKEALEVTYTISPKKNKIVCGIKTTKGKAVA